MAQVFVAHSRRDAPLRGFVTQVFAVTNVKAVLAEFEHAPNAEWIEEQITASNAVFVALDRHASAIAHTRDWIVWESGFGRALNKDVWVLEPVSSLGQVSVVVPHVSHYVLLEYTDQWVRYLRSVINRYDDRHVLPTVLACAGFGAALDREDRVRGAVVGTIGGIASEVFRMAKGYPGVPVLCIKCKSVYRVHLPPRSAVQVFRCPVCNTFLANPIAS